jgi:hypothetical protein
MFNNNTLVSQAVDKGCIALYDFFGSNAWAEDIDLDELDLGNASSCPLGQLFGEYCSGLDELGVHVDDAGRYGFSVCGAEFDHGNIEEDYLVLTEEWRERIERFRYMRGFRDHEPEPTTDLEIIISTSVRVTLDDRQLGELFREARGYDMTVEELLAERFNEVAEEAVNELDI